MVNLSAYLLFRHIQYVSWLVIVELGENVKLKKGLRRLHWQLVRIMSILDTGIVR